MNKRLVLLMSVWLVGCAAVPEQDTAVATDWREAFKQQQSIRAQTAQSRGELHTARVILASAVAADSGDVQLQQQLEAVTAQIESEVAQLQRAAQRHTDNGAVSRARSNWQKILVLDPGNTQALAELGALVSSSVRQQADTKANEELMARQIRSTGITDEVLAQAELALGRGNFAQVLALSEQFPDGIEHPEFKLQVAQSLAGLGRQAAADQAYEKALDYFARAQQMDSKTAAQIAPAQRDAHIAIGQKYYTLGLRKMRTDPAAAVEAFTQALEHTPDNAAAKGQLARARLMQEKLERLANQNQGR